ncbi:DUF3078 domain-containing protein [Gillisia sp. Hel_I_29]|uniref:DUF3078 domain-containing protein n=1 Tax=Gillisia sp. Hel_I_29 TaxID=1249975 RepID=UPI001E605337|nr:DUF3078 domain-containing protein [Gillisia sp. Hel_I_29]
MTKTFKKLMPLRFPTLGLILLLTFFISINSAFARKFPKLKIDTVSVDTTTVDTTAIIDQDVVLLWSQKNAVGVNLNEVAFVNWNAGGNNSISALFHGNFERKYKKQYTLWKSNIALRYGINAQEGRETRKTDDQLIVNSTFGYRRDSTSNWRYSAKFNFNTQFSNGYQYPDTEKPISKFMAPGYMFLGIGSEYTDPKEDLTLYISPVTQKSTFVLDQRLSNEGMFGVRPAIRDEEGNIIEEGENVRTEFGFLFTSGFTKEVFENINVDNQLSLYSDYLNKFGNVDVDWQLNINLTVNDFVKASIGSHLKYDDDVKSKKDSDGDGVLEAKGPKIQFKQMLGVGVLYEF